MVEECKIGEIYEVCFDKCLENPKGFDFSYNLLAYFIFAAFSTSSCLLGMITEQGPPIL